MYTFKLDLQHQTARVAEGGDDATVCLSRGGMGKGWDILLEKSHKQLNSTLSPSGTLISSFSMLSILGAFHLSG